MSFKDEQYFDQRPNGLSGNPMTKQDDAKDSYLREQVNSRLFADDFPILNDIEKDAVDNLVALIKEQVRLGKIEENDYHWHRQKNITEHAVNGVVSTYFLGRKAQLEQEGKK